jgi:hypothetical protein
LIQFSTSFVAAGTTHNALYYPDEYKGKTLLFEKAKTGGAILKSSHADLYCLNVEIDGKITPGFPYRSQLNFVVFSPGGGPLFHGGGRRPGTMLLRWAWGRRKYMSCTVKPLLLQLLQGDW